MREIRETKVEKLREYLEQENPGLSVETREEATTWLAYTFRFDRESEVVHLLMISFVVLDDYDVLTIIKMLQQHSWKKTLRDKGKERVILTSKGFQEPEPPK